MRLVLLCVHLVVLGGCKAPGSCGAMSPDQWSHVDGTPISWRIDDKVWRIEPGSGSIRTLATFQDVTIDLDFLIPIEETRPDSTGNSGVYVQNRYEIQILDSIDEGPVIHGCGAIYRFKSPDTDALMGRDQWQRYHIKFTAPRFSDDNKIADARMTVVHNGIVIHDDVAVTRKTGMGQPEGPAPGPIVLQDHGSAIHFRNIVITPRQ